MRSISTTTNYHGVVRIQIKNGSADNTRWVDIELFGNDGRASSFCIFDMSVEDFKKAIEEHGNEQ